jgi:hypothetical protein
MIPLSKFIPAAALFFSLFLHIHAQENLFDYGNTLKFARHLKTSGQFDFASEEFERLFFMYPEDTVLALELSDTYRAAGNCSKLTDLFSDIQSRSDLFQTISFTREYLRFSLKCKTARSDFFTWSLRLTPQEKNFYDLSYYWVNKQHQDAMVFNNTHPQTFHTGSRELSLLTTKFEQEKFKKPALAALMSAILPGSGKAYSKRWGDALVSLLFTGTNTYASYRAFKKKGPESLNGWIFGTLAFSFYSANIWGSAKAAKSYNTDVRTRYQNNAEIIIYNSY